MVRKNNKGDSELMIRQIRNALLWLKVYATRSASYITIVNLGMVLFLTLSSLKDKGYIHFNLGTYIIPFYILVVAVILLFGYFEIKFMKGYATETDFFNKYAPVHPIIMDIKSKVDYLYEKDKEKR